jgi:hypothetical protein
MAVEEENKRAAVWPDDFKDLVSALQYIMVGNKGEPISRLPKERITELIAVLGDAVPTVKGGATEATAVLLSAPAFSPEKPRKMEKASGWYKNATGAAWNAPSNFDNTNWWDGTKWYLSASNPMPVNLADGKVVEGDTKATSGDVVYKAVKPVNSLVNGGNISFGIMQEISTYNVTDTSEYVEVNLRKPITKKGKVKRVNIWASKIGDIRVAAFKGESAVGASLATLRNMIEFLLTCSAVGLNTFVDGTHFNNFLVEASWLVGVRKVAGGALPTRIALTTGTKGCARLASTTTPAVGSVSNMGTHPMEFAIEFEVEYVGIDSDLTATNKKVVVLESEANLAVKTTDYMLNYGNNYFDNTRIPDKYFDSAGNIQTDTTALGWEMAWVDVSMFKAGDQFTLGAMVISTGHSAWYTGDVKDGYAGSYSTGTLPKVYTYPSGISPKRLGITTKRNNVANPNIMVNAGAVAIPFEPYHKPTIKGLGDLEIEGAKNGDGGGAKSDQELYKTSSVEFAFITASGATFPVEVWDEVAPTEIKSGEIYAFDDGNPVSYAFRLKK